MKNKRYCIQQLIEEEKEHNLQVWKETNLCSDDLNALLLLCGGRTRIIDRLEGKIVFENKMDKE